MRYGAAGVLVSSAISVCSYGAAGMITDDAAMSAWLDGAAKPPESIAVLGHALRRDGTAGTAGGLRGVWVAMLGNMHALMAMLHGEQWSVSLIRFTSDHPTATGRGATIGEAAGHMLVAADSRRDELGIEQVLRLVVIGGAR